jgi:hypothetical protein
MEIRSIKDELSLCGVDCEKNDKSEWDSFWELSTASKTHFLEHGFVHVPQVIPTELVQSALREINDAIESSRNGKIEADDPYGLVTFSQCMGQQLQTPAIFNLLYNSGAWTLAQSLIGRGLVQRPTNAQVAIRPPELDDESADSHHGMRWHIDGINKGKHAPFTLLLGVALSDQPAHGCGNLVVFPGSHRLLQDDVRDGDALPATPTASSCS